MLSQRYGRKIKLPATAAIKHQLLLLMLEDEIRAIPTDRAFNPDTSAALCKLRRLKKADARLQA
ncbi:MAG: hypothetical protein ACO1NY_11900 [Pseudorhodoplanes sp.]